MHTSLNLEINCDEAFFKLENYEIREKYDSEVKIICEPQNLKIKRINELYKSNDPILEITINNNSYIDFYLQHSFDMMNTGEIKLRTSSNLEFDFLEQINLEVLKKFYFLNNNNNTLSRFSDTVIKLKLNKEDLEKELETAIKNVDDFLLLTSFISRERSFYYKWQLSFKDFKETLFRGNFSYPENDEYKRSNDGIIITPKYKIFMDHTFLKYKEINNIKSIRYAIHYLTNENIGTIETKFLSYFAGVETILDLYKKENKLEKILSKNKKQKFERYLKTCIQDCDFIEDNQKELMYCKIPELSRNSFQYIYDLFCKEYTINNEDLWPMFNNGKYISLTKLRNNLIHGSTIPRNYLKFMILATDNLKYILERFILSIIGWSISESNINSLQNNENLDAYMFELSQLFEGKK